MGTENTKNIDPQLGCIISLDYITLSSNESSLLLRFLTGFALLKRRAKKEKRKIHLGIKAIAGMTELSPKTYKNRLKHQNPNKRQEKNPKRYKKTTNTSTN